MLIQDILKFREVQLPENYLTTIRKSILVFGKYRQLLCFEEEIAEFLDEYEKHSHYTIKSDDPLFTEIIDIIVAIETIKDLLHISEYDLLKNSDETIGTITSVMYKMLIGISHYDRNRISKDDFCKLLANCYTAVYNLIDIRASWRAATLELDKKFGKFESQVKGLLNV